MEYPFIKNIGRILNSGQSRTVLVTGNIHDLFYCDKLNYVPVFNLLKSKWNLPSHIFISYELNGPIRFSNENDRVQMKSAYSEIKGGNESNDFDFSLSKAVGRPAFALEFMRQLCLCLRVIRSGELLNGSKYKSLSQKKLIVLIEGADLLIPDFGSNNLSESDRHKIAICHDWFSEPDFMNGPDSVVLLTESKSLIHSKIAKLPQLMEVSVTFPDREDRLQYINHFYFSIGKEISNEYAEMLADESGGLTIHALRQMITESIYENKELSSREISLRIETFVKSQLGEDVVEFKKPTHSLKDVVGNKSLKKFVQEKLIPRITTKDEGSISGAAISGSIGAGKTFIFEALASELDMPVILLKNIRSKWYGDTDLIFERLQRVILGLNRVCIFVDEADTQFGNLNGDSHETERRLTGKIQSMMSAPTLKGKVVWLLMTARIHALSPDIRRPGRVGDLIIPVFDPVGDDKREFVNWMVESVFPIDQMTQENYDAIDQHTKGYSAANFSSLRSELIAEFQGKTPKFEDICSVIQDVIPADIGLSRRFQELQALMNCTRVSLLPDQYRDGLESHRKEWEMEIAELKRLGIK